MALTRRPSHLSFLGQASSRPPGRRKEQKCRCGPRRARGSAARWFAAEAICSVNCVWIGEELP